ncbi:type II secretion system F family protein [Candidatus Palauibacter sp.]|uniref:type II secretion system F family protein n=1 Tax=Candidatus Palauibacter sp. TaxID=3101350 RepID=UPI003B52E7EA
MDKVTGRWHGSGVDDAGAGGRFTPLRLLPPPRARNRDLVLFTRQLSVMISAGLPLTRALETLAQQAESPVLQRVARETLYDIESGNTLADALGRHPRVFTRLYVNMVRAGESGSRLDGILTRLAAFLEQNERIRRKVKGAMLYPAVIFAVAVAVVATLLLFVIPTFETVFASFNALLPLPTRTVIGLSRAVQNWWWAVVVTAGGGGLLLRRWVATETGRRRFDSLLLRLPVLGPLWRRAAVSRFTRTLGTLLSAGVPILEGLEITARTAGNRVIQDAVLESRTAIRGGESIARPLRETGVFPPMVARMIHVGEETGDLDGMLSRIADFYDEEVDAGVESLLKILEPALIVVLGGLVGGMTIAMYLPIFDLVDAIQ